MTGKDAHAAALGAEERSDEAPGAVPGGQGLAIKARSS